MVELPEDVVPIVGLTAGSTEIPVRLPDSGMTPERVRELRGALAFFADAPIATLEVHPRPEGLDVSQGLALSAASPLAQQLAALVSRGVSGAGAAGAGDLYRMVLPAKVAADVAGGLLRPMTSAVVSGGVHGALVNGGRIAAQASFVPVAGTAAGVGGVAAGAGALAFAAPLMLMAVAAGASAYADHQRAKAIQGLRVLLEKLEQDRLDEERDRLQGCRAAIDKATAILLDEGRIGASLGLDSAVHAIDVAVETAERRMMRWRRELQKLPGDKVELNKLKEVLPGIDAPEGEFQAHLELADLAIALKKRVLVLQAVEHAQANEGNGLAGFTGALARDGRRVEELQRGINGILSGLASITIDRSHGVMDFTFMSGEVDRLLDAAYRVRALGERVAPPAGDYDVAIDIVRDVDGSIRVLPPVSVA